MRIIGTLDRYFLAKTDEGYLVGELIVLDKFDSLAEASERFARYAQGEREVIDTEAACDMLMVSRPTLYKYVRLGNIRAVRIGRSWKFSRAEIERFLLSGQNLCVPRGQENASGISTDQRNL